MGTLGLWIYIFISSDKGVFMKLLGAIHRSFGLLVLVSLLICIVPSTAHSQRDTEETRNQLALILGARVNGYGITEDENGDFYIDIQGATNPVSGKKMDGTFDLAYRCANVASVIVVAVILARGRAREKVRCMVKKNPFIYY